MNGTSKSTEQPYDPSSSSVIFLVDANFNDRNELDRSLIYTPALIAQMENDDDWKASSAEDSKQSKKDEKPKVILGRNRISAFRHLILFHALPIGGSLGLIVLNTRSWFYTGDVDRIPLFQFLAKVHESLILISIAIIMVAYLQYLLIHKRAVPFGSIFFAHQMTHMGYLVSPEFWAALTSPGFPWSMRIGFAIIIIFSVFLASVVGPSSAIAIQPRMTNYTLPGWEDAGLNASMDYVYPTTLVNDTELPPDWEDLQGLEIPPVAGPDGVGRTAQVGYVPEKYSGLSLPELYSSTNRKYITSAEDYSHPAREMYIQYAPHATIATIAQLSVAYAMVNADYASPEDYTWDIYGSVASADMPQAYVSTVCELNTIMGESDRRPIRFPNSYLIDSPIPTTYDELGTGINIPNVTLHETIPRKDIWAENAKTRKGRIIWVEGGIEVSSPVPGPALGAIVVHPEPCKTNISPTFLTVSACVAGARWVNTTVQHIWSKNEHHVENVLSTDTLVYAPDWRNKDSKSTPLINLTADWASSTVGAIREFNRTITYEDEFPASSYIDSQDAADTLLKSLPITASLCPVNGTYRGQYRPLMHEAALSALISNAISYHHSTVESFILLDGIWQSYDGVRLTGQPGTVFTARRVLTGYAWTLHGTSIKVAIAVLCLYCIFALSYVLYTLITGRSSLAWSSISDLVALAMNSTPTERLKNTGAGVSKADIFRNLVNVKECGDGRKIQLVFEKDIRDGKTRSDIVYRGIRAGRAYG
ncbi:hypothetical protein FQN49_001758 [Arthroderma sp. PD_2]|nr:hypothetical protein FQN49_001758 [Arthroderma sp. PD_2]